MALTIHRSQVVCERYRIEHELGRGAMGVVFLATDVRHDRSVALKVLLPTADAPDALDRFFDEIRTVADLGHPNIVPVQDSGEIDGTPFYVTPYIAGETLRQRLNRQPCLAVDEALRIIGQVLGALGHAHASGVIHRDIKPENVLIDEQGNAYVIDFGLARSLALDVRRTLEGTALGSPQYMSPEQVKGDRDVDGRADLYAVGCILFEMIAGRPPFFGPDVYEVMTQHLNLQPPALRAGAADAPAWLERVVHRALSKDRDSRPPSAAAFQDELVDPARGRRAPGRWYGWRRGGLSLVAAWLAASSATGGPVERSPRAGVQAEAGLPEG